jgi:hypothetical protein
MNMLKILAKLMIHKYSEDIGQIEYAEVFFYSDGPSNSTAD